MNYNRAIEEFINYKKPSDISIGEYLREFKRRYRMLQECREDTTTHLFDDELLAYFCLHNANLNPEQVRLVKATVQKLTLEEMETTLKRTYGEIPRASTSSMSSNSGYRIKEEPPTMYTHDDQYQYYDQYPEYEEYYEDYSSQYPSTSDSDITDAESGSLNEEQQVYEEENTYYQHYPRPRPPGRGNPYGRGHWQPYGRGRARGHQSGFRRPFNGRPRGMQSHPYSNQKGQGIQSQSYSNQQAPGITCYNCRKIGHCARDCPEKPRTAPKRGSYGKFSGPTYFQSDFNLNEQDEDTIYLTGEAVNKALLDTGAASTVCGQRWLDVFEETLTPAQKSSIKVKATNKPYRFGDGKVTYASVQKTLPVNICGQDVFLETHVVKNDIPLLLSRTSMKKMKMVIDNEHDKIYALGGQEDLITTASGHIVIPIAKDKAEVMMTCATEEDCQVMDTYLVDEKNPEQCAEHLHKYFGHGPTSKIAHFIRSITGVENGEDVIRALESIKKRCDFCLKTNTKEAPHRKVGLPLGKTFNDTVAMDLKLLKNGQWILHMIDTVTRFSSAACVKSKCADEILRKVFERWISIFGQPKSFLSDNGGEFVNDKFTEMCSVMNIRFKTSPSESPWCNGIVERHHTMLANMTEAILGDTSCSVDVALAWASNAKNTLSNVFGFSAHQLVFGTNPNVPGILTYESLPVLNEETSSKIVAEHLNAMESARTAFIKFENCQKMRRLYRERVYKIENIRYCSGDCVYYKRNNSSDWHGPANVVGHIGNQVLIKHGGSLIRMHPCKVILKELADSDVNKETSQPSQSELQTRSNNVKPVLQVRRAQIQQEAYSETYSDSDSDEAEEKIPPHTHVEENKSVSRPLEEANTDHTVNGSVTNDLASSEQVIEHHVIASEEEDVSPEEKISSEDHLSSEEEVSSTQTATPDTCPYDWKEILSRESTNKITNLAADNHIRFRANNEDDWTPALVISRSGKATSNTTKNRYNVLVDGDSEGGPIDLDKFEVQKAVPKEQVVLYEEEGTMTIFNVNASEDVKLQKAKEDELTKFRSYGVYSEVQDIGQSAISCRWVITKKGQTTK